MEELKIPYFDLTSDILEAYNLKKGNIEEQTDAIGITHFKVGHAKAKLEATRRRHAAMNSPPPSAAAGAGVATAGVATAGSAQELPAYTQGGYTQPVGDNKYQAPGTPASATPPAYSPVGGAPVGAPAAAVAAPAQTCTALYDYTAQAQGDLTFPAGAVIEIVERTADANGWWTGRYNGQVGVFPGNYVQL